MSLIRHSLCFKIFSRRMLSQTVVRLKSIKLDKRPDPHKINCDFIGPPDKSSNLRPIVHHIPENETAIGKKLRLKAIEVEQWNQEFWMRHNKRFYEEKNEFIKKRKNSGQETISADEMSIFYKYFLDKNWKIHFYYNISWYIKNFHLLFLSLQYNIVKYFRKSIG